MRYNYYWPTKPQNEVVKYQGEFLAVHELTVGNQIFEKAYITPGITIFPITERQTLLLVKEFRPHETPSVRWKPVTGFFESQFSYEENVSRELQEEIGFLPKKILPYFEERQTGTINVVSYFALALNLTPSKLPNPDGEDTILEFREFSFHEVLQKTLTGDLAGGRTAFALLKLCLEFKEGKIAHLLSE